MKLKLTKTLLSKRPEPKDIYAGVLSVLTLWLIFFITDNSWTASGKLVFENKEYWRAFTTTFIHGDFSHLSNNSFFFTGLAILLHTYFGSFMFPLVSLIAGGLINLVVLKFYPPEVHLVGISGVIYFMAAFWLVLYIGIERKLTLTRRLINATALTLIFLFPEALKQEVSYLAHGVGFGMGLIVGMLYYFFQREYFKSQEIWEEVEDLEEDIIYLSEEDYSFSESKPSPSFCLDKQ